MNDGNFYGFFIENQFGDIIDSCGGFWSVEEIKESLSCLRISKQLEKRGIK